MIPQESIEYLNQSSTNQISVFYMGENFKMITKKNPGNPLFLLYRIKFIDDLPEPRMISLTYDELNEVYLEKDYIRINRDNKIDSLFNNPNE